MSVNRATNKQAAGVAKMLGKPDVQSNSMECQGWRNRTCRPIFPTAPSTGRLSSDSTFPMQLSESKPRPCWTPPNSICGVQTLNVRRNLDSEKALCIYFPYFPGYLYLPSNICSNELELCHYKQVLN